MKASDVHSVRILEGRFPEKLTKYLSKSAFLARKFDEHFTKIASQNAQIALKPPENEVSAFKIRFETELHRKSLQIQDADIV